jgi:hypothetical protein
MKQITHPRCSRDVNNFCNFTPSSTRLQGVVCQQRKTFSLPCYYYTDVFYLPNSGVVGSDHTRAMDICVSSVFVWFYALQRANSTSKGTYQQTVKQEGLGRIDPGPCPVNCCWSSPISPCFPDPVGTHNQISVRYKTVYVFRNGISTSTRRGVGLSE